MSASYVFLALIIVAGILGYTAIENLGKTRRANSKHLNALERQLEERLARIEQLEERIAVLEKIVTDRRFDLDQQLRDLGKTG